MKSSEFVHLYFCRWFVRYTVICVSLTYNSFNCSSCRDDKKKKKRKKTAKSTLSFSMDDEAEGESRSVDVLEKIKDDDDEDSSKPPLLILHELARIHDHLLPPT